MRKVTVIVSCLAFTFPAFAQAPQQMQQQQQQNDPTQESVALSYRQLGLSLNDLLRSQQDKVNTLQQKINDLNKYWLDYTANSTPKVGAK